MNLKKIDDLKPCPWNPREISQEASKALGVSLREFGDISGIVFNFPHKPFVGQRRLDAAWANQGIWDDIQGNANQEGHCASFPVEIPLRNIRLYSDEDDAILEPFAGAGTTIVACENLKRKCRAIEISPAYCAVTLERMAMAFPGILIKCETP